MMPHCLQHPLYMYHGMWVCPEHEPYMSVRSFINDCDTYDGGGMHHVVRRPDGLQIFQAIKVLCGEGGEIATADGGLHLPELQHHLGPILADECLT